MSDDGVRDTKEGKEMSDHPDGLFVMRGISMQDGAVTPHCFEERPYSSRAEECFGPFYVRADLLTAAENEAARLRSVLADALRENAEMRAALMELLAYRAAVEVIAPDMIGLLRAMQRGKAALSGAAPSDGAIYAAVSRAQDPEGYDAMLEELRSVLITAAEKDEAITTLREALAPFAEAAAVLAAEYGHLMKPETGCNIKFSALDYARAALAETEPKP